MPTQFETMMMQIREIGFSFLHFANAKIGLAIVIGIAEFLFGVQDNQSLLALLILVVIDLATGVGSTRFTAEPITSRRVFKTAVKTSVYLVLICSAHLTEYIIPGVTFIDEAMISFLALTELVSIMENIGKMGYMVPQKLLNQLRTKRDEI